MTSGAEERPRLVTGGYGRHRSQWVKQKIKPDMGLHGKEREGQAGQKQRGEVSRKGEVHSRLAVME